MTPTEVPKHLYISLTDLLENVKIDDVLSFLRDTELYQKIWRIKLVNLVQTNEILVIENFTYLSIRLEIFGWIYIYIETEFGVK